MKNYLKHIALITLLLITTASQAKTHHVNTQSKIISAIKIAKPGDIISIAPGTYQGGIYLTNIQGTKAKPITITAALKSHPPLFDGKFKQAESFHLVSSNYIHLKNLKITRYYGNGLNIDNKNAKQPYVKGILLDNLNITHVGPKGNYDAIKLSGLTDFTIQNCFINAYASSGIDMVGCNNGIIQNITFSNHPNYKPTTGIQLKGGCHDIKVLTSFFNNTAPRAINLGGSTGLQFFRPLNAPFEAKKHHHRRQPFRRQQRSHRLRIFNRQRSPPQHLRQPP